ncbi:MAG TPA: hypothetical protein VFZ48_01575 [Candidatus Saccharimonadales bacterium]
MQKKYNKTVRLLIRELTALRKGTGLSPRKLRHAPTLHALVSRLMNMPGTSLTSNQTHAFLLAEIAKISNTRGGKALYNALGVDPQSADALSNRRAALAQAIGKHPDTIERYENEGFAELAIHLLEQTAQHAQPSQSPPISPAYLQQLENQAAMARAATVLNLSGMLSLGRRAEEFMQYLEAHHQPYLDAIINIKLMASRRGKGWYRIEVRYAFQGRFSVFRVAAVTNNKDGENLMRRGLIHEFHKLNDTVEPAREMRAIINSSTLSLYHPGTRQQKLLRFYELEPQPAQQLLQSVDRPLLGTCRLLEIAIPPDWEIPETVFEYRNTLNLREDLRYAYWYAPGLMYVKKITLDYSDFPDADRRQFKALPFLGHITGDDLISDQRCFTLYPNNWLVPGHGIGLMWE